MPAELDNIVDGLLESKSFKASYATLKRKSKSFAKKFPTLKSYAFARANVMLKDKQKSAASEVSYDGRETMVIAASGFSVKDERAKALFKDGRVKSYLKGKMQPGHNSSILLTELAELDKMAKPFNMWGLGPVSLSSKNAEKVWKELEGKPVIVDKTLSGHGFMGDRQTIGTVIEVVIDRAGKYPKVLTASQVWDREVGGIWDLMQEIQDVLGASYEVGHTLEDLLEGEDEDGGYTISDYHPMGQAILRRSKAAHSEMRVLAASAYPDTIDGDGSGSGSASPEDADHPSAGSPGGDGGGSVAPTLAQPNGSEEATKRAKAKSGRARKGSSGSKGALMVQRSPEVNALLGQFADEDRAQVENLVDVMASQMATSQATAEELSKRDTKIGELTAQLSTITSDRDTLKGKVDEYERQKKVSDQTAAAESKFAELVKEGKYLDKDKGTIVPLLAKGMVDEPMTFDEAETFASLRVAISETAALPGGTPAVGSTAAGALDDAARDKLREGFEESLGLKKKGG